MTKAIKKSDDERIGKPIKFQKEVNVPKSERELKLIRHKKLREEVLETQSEKSRVNSEFNAHIKALNKEEVDLLKVIDTGTETVEVDAWPIFNYRTGNVRILEQSTGKQLDERAMTPEELKTPILDYMEPSAQGSASEEEADEEAAAKANAAARDAKKAAKKAASKAKKTVEHSPTDKPRQRRARAAE